MDLPDQTSTPIRWPSADPVNPDAPDPKRPKIIQIAINPEGDSAYSVLFVLRDDGTVWQLPLMANNSSNLQWTQVNPIP